MPSLLPSTTSPSSSPSTSSTTTSTTPLVAPLFDGEYQQPCACASCERRGSSIDNDPGLTTITPSNSRSHQHHPHRRRRRPRFVDVLAVWLSISLLTQQVTGLGFPPTLVPSPAASSASTPPSTANSHSHSHSEGVVSLIEDPGGGGGGGGSSGDYDMLRVNPFLRHRRLQRLSEHAMCHVWTPHSPHDLCAKSRWQRLRRIRELSLFSKDCSSESSNVQLGELFRLPWAKIKSEDDLVSYTEHIKPGVAGRDCLLAPAGSDECLACYRRIDTAIKDMDRAYDAFNYTLRRFDCMLAVDSASATRPFSPNGTCDDCKLWYRKWLMVTLLDIWVIASCINWCYYAQLACPHLATSRQVDYAGHPSFICLDLDIPQPGRHTQEEEAHCDCFHPCDLGPVPPEPPGWYAKNKNRLKNVRQYDFFASSDHCWARRHRCRELKAELQLQRHRKRPSLSTPAPASGNAAGEDADDEGGLGALIQRTPAALWRRLQSWLFPASSAASVVGDEANAANATASQLPSNNHRRRRNQFAGAPPSSSASSSSAVAIALLPSSFVLLLTSLLKCC